MTSVLGRELQAKRGARKEEGIYGIGCLARIFPSGCDQERLQLFHHLDRMLIVALELATSSSLGAIEIPFFKGHLNDTRSSGYCLQAIYPGEQHLSCLSSLIGSRETKGLWA